MKRTTVVVPCLFALACAAHDASPDELRAAVPRHEVLAMSLGPLGPPAQPACVPSGPSTFGTVTHEVAGTVDGVLSDVLGIVDEVTAQPPAAEGAGQAMWGPIVGDTSVYTFAVQQTGASAFNFFLGGGPQGSTADPEGVLGGASVVTDALHRSGEVEINFSVMHALDPSVDPVEGGADVTYAVGDDGRDVTAYFGGIVTLADPEPTDSAYAFTESADGTVGFAFSTHLDFDEDGTSDELVHIDSRWAADGRGTAHVEVTGGSLGQTAVHATECWDAALERVFSADDQNVNGGTGDAGCCPF